MTIQTAVLIETLKALRSDPCCYCYKNFSTQDHAVASITYDESAAVFSWNSEILKEYWYYILNALIWPKDGGKGRRPDLIFDDGEDMTFLIH